MRATLSTSAYRLIGGAALAGLLLHVAFDPSEIGMTDTERRYVCRLIDSAVERCEEGNLRDRLEVPRWVAEVVVQLQAAAGEDLLIPRDTVTAHGQLLDVREHYMRAAKHGREIGSGSACNSCGKPMSPLCRRTTCTQCRRLQRLTARVAGVLAS
jgi:hypothetical protein